MPTERGYRYELLAKDFVEGCLGVRVEHTGRSSQKPDLVVHLESELYEIDVTLAIEEWRMRQRGTLFRNGGFELCEIAAMPVSLFVQIGRDTQIKELDHVAVELAEIIEKLEINSVSSTDFYKANGDATIWNITKEHQELFRMCQQLDLRWLQKVPGSGELIRICTSYGGSWGGGNEEFNQWLNTFLYSDETKGKIARATALASGLLGLFVWLDSSLNYGAHEWLERGQGNPNEIDLDSIGIKELWVASLFPPHSFVRLSAEGWYSRHLGESREQWFS